MVVYLIEGEVSDEYRRDSAGYGRRASVFMRQFSACFSEVVQRKENKRELFMSPMENKFLHLNMLAFAANKNG